MKKLNLFQKFDFAKWQSGKKFVVQSVKYNEKKECDSIGAYQYIACAEYHGYGGFLEKQLSERPKASADNFYWNVSLYTVPFYIEKRTEI